MTSATANPATAVIAIGLGLAVVHLVGIPVTGTSVNPGPRSGPGPGGGRHSAQPAAAQPLDDWEHAHLAATRKLNDELTRIVPEVTQLEFVLETADGGCHTARFAILVGQAVSDPEERARTGGTLTPVMARLGPADLETLDTLITAGIATTRADAVRWALARILERPAYERLRERTRELEELKSQF